MEHSAQCISAKDKWEWIKRLKKGYTAKALALKDKDGKLVNSLKQADTFAEYLRDKHWATPPTEYTGSNDPIHTDTIIDMSPFTLKELDKAIAKMKSNKAPGPDNLPSEVYKWLNHDNRAALLHIFNQIDLQHRQNTHRMESSDSGGNIQRKREPH